MKPLYWVASAKEELKDLPDEVRDGIGYALHLAQAGMKSPKAKPLKGFGGAGVVEVVEDHRGNAYRAVYTVKFADAIFVLHCFQKKSVKGIETPKTTIDLIRKRLQQVEIFIKDSQ